MDPIQRAETVIYTVAILVAVGVVAIRVFRENARMAVGLFALAALARIALVTLTGKLFAPDTFEYEEMARGALAGAGFGYSLLGTHYRTYGTPLYVLFNTFVYDRFGPSPAALVLIDVAIASVTAPIAFALARRILGAGAGLTAGVLVALHPGLLVYAGKLHALDIEVTIAAALALAAVWWAETRSARDAVLLGALAAIGGMSRPTLLLAVPPLAAWTLWSAPDRRRASRQIVLAAASISFVLLPWTAYASALYGRPMFMNATGGIVFWYGNNPFASGSAVDPTGRGLLTYAPTELLVAVSGTDDLSADAAFRAAAWSYIRDDPPAAVRRTLLKLLGFWTVPATAGALYPQRWLWPYVAYYALALGLAAAGVRYWWRLGRQAPHVVVAVGSIPLLVSVVQSLFYVDGRHRWEIEPLMLVLSAGGIVALASALGCRRIRGALAPAADDAPYRVR